MLKERSTYEIIDPADVGAGGSSIVLTARSGRHALRHRIAELGNELPDAEFEKVYEAFLTLADKKKEVFDEDIEALISDKVKHIAEVYVLKSLQGGKRYRDYADSHGGNAGERHDALSRPARATARLTPYIEPSQRSRVPRASSTPIL